MTVRRQWLIRNGAIAVFLILFWNTVLVRPFRVLVVLLHEIFHALAAVITGGGVHAIEIVSHRTGLTSLYGGVPGVVFSAGYIGTAFFGSLLIGSSYHYPVKRSLYLCIGILILANTLVFVRTPLGWGYGLLAGFFLITLFFKEFWFSPYIADFIGLLCIVDVFYDLSGFFITYSRNDAAILSSLSGLSYYLILAIWAIAVAALISSAIYITLRNLSPEKLPAKLQHEDFQFVTRRFAERSLSMSEKEKIVDRRRGRRTIVVYVSLFAVLVLVTIWASRFVLFQPWTAREWVTVEAARGDVYIFGGRDRQGQTFDEIYRVDLQDLRIHKIGSLPSPRFATAAVALDDRIYILGGFDGRRCFKDILVFETKSRRISKLGELPSSRCFGAAAVENGQIYYFGGWDGSDQLDEIIRIDPDTGDTELTGRLPSPRELITAEALAGKIFVFGGSDEHGDYLEEVVEIDPSHGSVTVIGKLPSSRARSSAVTMDHQILLIGGWEGKKIREVLVLESDLQIRQYAQLERGLSDIGAVNLDGEIYLIGGTHERFQRQIQVLLWNPDSNRMDSIKFRSFLFW
jgi:N-acetylneuraminic acid mutarotase